MELFLVIFWRERLKGLVLVPELDLSKTRRVCVGSSHEKGDKEERRSVEGRGEGTGEKSLGTLGKLAKKELKCLKAIVNCSPETMCSEMISPSSPSHFFSLFRF